MVDRWFWDERKKVLDAGKSPMEELKASQYVSLRLYDSTPQLFVDYMQILTVFQDQRNSS